MFSISPQQPLAILGGLGIAMCLAAAMFDAMSGSTWPMRRPLCHWLPHAGGEWLPSRLAVGLLAAAAPLRHDPASTHMVMYGAITQQSIGTCSLRESSRSRDGDSLRRVYLYCLTPRRYGKSTEQFSSRGCYLRLENASGRFDACHHRGRHLSGIASPQRQPPSRPLWLCGHGLVYVNSTERRPQNIPGNVNITSMIFMIIMFSGVFGFVLAEQQFAQILTNTV